MVRLIRRPGKKVDFREDVIGGAMDKKENEIKKKFSEIKKTGETIRRIQSGSDIQTEGVLENERKISQKQVELQRMASLWEDLNNIDLSDLGREEIMKILNSQKSFIKDLLENYINSTKKEKQYIWRLKRFE